MKQTNKETQKVLSLTILLVLGIVILSIAPFYRIVEFNGNPTSEQAYFHLYMGQYLMDNSIPQDVPNAVLTKEYRVDPFHYIIGMSAKIIGEKTTALFIPFTLGIITLLLLYSLLQVFIPVTKERLLATIFIVISPIFVIAFSQLKTLAWVTALVTLILWTLTKNKKIQFFAYVLTPILLFYDVIHAIMALIFILIITTKREQNKQGIILATIIAVGIIIKVLVNGINIEVSVPSLLSLVQIMLSDTGGFLGFSLFGMILAIIGAQYIIDDRKAEYQHIIAAAVAVMYTVWVSQVANVYLNVYVGIIGAYGFLRLAKREWKIQQVRNITLFLLILGIVYSGTATVTTIATAYPSTETIEAINWFSQDLEATILTNAAYGSIVVQQTHQTVVSIGAPADNQGREILQTVFSSRRIDKTQKILDDLSISHIIIFGEKRADMIWNREQEGLIFLLENGENFKKVFENNQTVIWEIVPRGDEDINK